MSFKQKTRRKKSAAKGRKKQEGVDPTMAPHVANKLKGADQTGKGENFSSPFQLQKAPVQKKSNPSSFPHAINSKSRKPIQRKAKDTKKKGLQKMENAFQQDFSDVNIHENSPSAKAEDAKAYTQGNDIHFAPGEYQPETQKGQELLGHELSHVVQQREGRVPPNTQTETGAPLNDNSALENEADVNGKAAAQSQSPTAVSQHSSSLSSTDHSNKVLQKKETPLQKLKRLLGQWDVPEMQAVNLIGTLSNAEKATVISTPYYKQRMTASLNVSEMVKAINHLGLTLPQKLTWIQASSPGYAAIKPWITSATAAQLGSLKTAAWKTYFVNACTNATIIECLNDLKFDLETKLTWVLLEMTPNYSQIKSWITKATQAERDILKTNYWKAQFANICINANIIECLDDLNFDFETKLNWVIAEMTPNYSQIKHWILKATQAEKDKLKTSAWQTYFVNVCTNATIIECLNDLKFDLATKIIWVRTEMTPNYSQVKPWVVAATQPQRDALKNTIHMNHFVAICTDVTMEEALIDLKFDLSTRIQWLIGEGNYYKVFKRVILAAPAGERATALADQPLLTSIKNYFYWNDFARTVQLLGRTPPTGAQMIGDPTVQAALASAWAASNPAIVPSGGPVPPGVHEEGGFVYQNLITGSLTTSRVAAGSQASLPLNNPKPPANSITVGGFHTHPNVGAAWGPPFPSPADTKWATRNGIPLIFRGAHPLVANVSDGDTGPTRLHLAGSTGFPGKAGGLAPQAPLDGSFDAI